MSNGYVKTCEAEPKEKLKGDDPMEKKDLGMHGGCRKQRSLYD